MNVVDSCGWLEYFADGANADFFAPAIEAADELVVPTLGIYEVFKRVAQQRGEEEAFRKVAFMQRALVAGLNAAVALDSARISLSLRLPLADSVMLATAKTFGATLLTQDAHFAGIEGVSYIPVASA